MRTLKKTIIAALSLAAAIGIPAVAMGYGDGTPDEMPPAEELPCDTANLQRAAYGLCIAYCEAGDCNLQPDEQSCVRLRANFERLTGESVFPCEFYGQS